MNTNTPGHEPKHPDHPVIALQSTSEYELLESNPTALIGDTRPMKQRALERWENEGGEIPIRQLRTRFRQLS